MLNGSDAGLAQRMACRYHMSAVDAKVGEGSGAESGVRRGGLEVRGESER